MLRLAADEDFDGSIIRGLRRRLPDLDIVRVQDAGLSGALDAVVLAWAAQDDRMLLTHDVDTLIADAWSRVRNGLPMPGVCAVHQQTAVGRAIDQLQLLITASQEGECRDRVVFVGGEER
jgi:hypothetical protein